MDTLLHKEFREVLKQELSYIVNAEFYLISIV